MLVMQFFAGLWVLRFVFFCAWLNFSSLVWCLFCLVVCCVVLIVLALLALHFTLRFGWCGLLVCVRFEFVLVV